MKAKEWQIIEKIIQVQRRSKWALQDIINGIFYVCKNGCVWRDLPCDFPPYQTVYWYYSKWIKEGTWESINQCLTVDYREKSDKKAQPSVAIIDSQSVKNSATCTEKTGFDGGKKIKGRKRFFIVDTLGNLLDSFVCPANFHDGTTASDVWDSLVLDNPILEQLHTVYADGTFGGTFRRQMGEQRGIEVIIPHVPIAKKGKLEIHEKRRIVERTISWIGNNRRCAKDYERKTDNSNAFLLIANIRRIVRKI